MIRLVPFLLLLAACGRTHRPGCDVSTRTLPMDEVLPDLDFTLADLFADLGGERVVPAQFLDADRSVLETAAVSVELTATDADALWTDAVPIDIVTPTFGIGDYYLMMYVACSSGVTADATLDVAREDDAATLTADAALSATPDELAAGAARVESEEVTGEGDWSDVTFAYAGYGEGLLEGVQLQSENDITVDWR